MTIEDVIPYLATRPLPALSSPHDMAPGRQRMRECGTTHRLSGLENSSRFPSLIEPGLVTPVSRLWERATTRCSRKVFELLRRGRTRSRLMSLDRCMTG